MWIVVVTRENGTVFLYGRYESKELANDVHRRVGGELITFDEYKKRHF